MPPINPTNETKAPTIATMVVRRDTSIAATQLATTADGAPDVHLKAVSPWKIVAIRSARVFFQTLSGSIGVSTFSSILSLKGAVVVAAATAAVTALQNTAELLAKLDQTMPEFRG
jgi:hypothetical protein